MSNSRLFSRTGATGLSTEAASREKIRTARIRHRIELLSSALMAAATIATAWSAYQSALWNSDHTSSKARATTATIRSAKYSNLAVQRSSLHVHLFVQWTSAVNAGDTAMSEFLLARFPEPLRTAAVAWRATGPLTNPDAPPTPFDMPEYVVNESGEADRWDAIATLESAAADEASETANRYLLFTIIFASVLFFAGISGKFRSKSIDLTVLVLGALTLFVGVTVMLLSPRL